MGISGQEKPKEKEEKYFAVDLEGFHLFDDPSKPEVYLKALTKLDGPKMEVEPNQKNGSYEVSQVLHIPCRRCKR